MSGHYRGPASAALAAVLVACASPPADRAPVPAQPERGQDAHAAIVQREVNTASIPHNVHLSPAVQEPRGQWPAPVHDDRSFTFLRAEQLEYRARDDGSDVARWEAQGWHGGDYERLWIKTEGEQAVEGTPEGDLQVQALYSQLITPFWDFQAGARYDGRWGSGPDNDRWFGVVGVQGLAPYVFEVEAALFVSEEADVSARLMASTDVLITQRLILQPRFEAEIAAQEVADFQVGRGLNYIELGLRLRYEFKREFAPYIGVNWNRSVGETEDLVLRDGGDASNLAFVLGMSLWF